MEEDSPKQKEGQRLVTVGKHFLVFFCFFCFWFCAAAALFLLNFIFRSGRAPALRNPKEKESPERARVCRVHYSTLSLFLSPESPLGLRMLQD